VKYMVMTYGDQSAWDALAGGGAAPMSEDQIAAHFQAMRAFHEELTASGELVAAFGLADPAHTQVVEVRGELPVVSDGPYAEAKEVLAGFGIVEVDGHDRAVALAARFAQVVGTRVELRPIDG
jgi:hypothetical protein